MRILISNSGLTKLQTVIAVAILVAIAIGTAYYYRGFTNLGSKPSPSPTLIPLPYDAFDFYPEPNSTNVSINTNITVYLTRLPQVVILQLSPSPGGSMNRTDEMVGAGTDKSTFVFSKPLLPGTTYIATVTFGEENPPTGYLPLNSDTWNFTTSP